MNEKLNDKMKELEMKKIKINPYQKKLMEIYIFQCEKCGRISRYYFYGYCPNKNRYGFCNGKVKRIKFKNAW